MLKIFHKLFPIIDHLYIFQLLEYESARFFRWFIKNPLARNLQRKGKLNLTQKSSLILTISLVLMAGLTSFLTFQISVINILTFVLIFLFLQLFSPLFLILSWWAIYPIQKYIEARLIQKAKNKLIKGEDLKVIAIWGSYGKTSTKNILHTLLWKKFYTVKTPKSYNTLISIAQTILSDIKNNTQVFLVEMDTYKEGDLKRLGDIVSPDFGILSSIAPQHLERFGGMDKLSDAQMEAIPTIKYKVFANGDDEWVKKKLKKTDKVKFFGTSNDLDFKASNIKENEEGLTFDLNFGKEKIPIELPLNGKHNISNFLAAASLAREIGLSPSEIKQRAKLILPTEHRLEVKIVNGITLIDNSFNTNPDVSKSSLDLLSKQKGKKILITPGFVELGSEKRAKTIDFMKMAAKTSDHIIIVGNNSKKELSEGLKMTNFPKEKVYFSKDTNSALALAYSIGKSGDAILLENDLPDQYF